MEPNLTLMVVEITFDADRTSPAQIRERIERQTGVWGTENISES
jgi:hypothetical protein